VFDSNLYFILVEWLERVTQVKERCRIYSVKRLVPGNAGTGYGFWGQSSIST